MVDDAGYQTIVELLTEQYEKGPEPKPGPFAPPSGGVPLPGMARPAAPGASSPARPGTPPPVPPRPGRPGTPPPVPPRPGRPQAPPLPGAQAGWKGGTVPQAPRGSNRAGEHRAFAVVFEAQKEMVATLFKGATIRYKAGKSVREEVKRDASDLFKSLKETGKSAADDHAAGKSWAPGRTPSKTFQMGGSGGASASTAQTKVAADLGVSVGTLHSMPASEMGSLGKGLVRAVAGLSPQDLVELTPFITEIAGDIFADLGASMVPLLKDAKAGVQLVSKWVDTGKKAMAAHDADRAKLMMRTGDPQAAVQAVVQLLELERNRLAAEAGIETGKFAAGVGGYFADLGTATTVAVATTSALAKVGIRIHALVRDARELKAGRALLSAGRFDRELFTACPILGAYVVTCSDTSYMVGMVSPPGAKVSLEDLERVIRKHLHPLQKEARGLIEASRLTVDGVASNKGQFRPMSDRSYMQRLKMTAKQKLKGALHG